MKLMVAKLKISIIIKIIVRNNQKWNLSNFGAFDPPRVQSGKLKSGFAKFQICKTCLMIFSWSQYLKGLTLEALSGGGGESP